jgi:hypothetical protein
MKYTGKYLLRFLLIILLAVSAVPFLSNPVYAAINVSSSPAALASGQVGHSYSATFIAGSGTVPFTWTITGLPPGVTKSASTTNVVSISGTPTTAGTYTVIVQITAALL